jgi:prophage antirepressor-like protein
MDAMIEALRARFNVHTIRRLIVHDQSWFVASDVCRALRKSHWRSAVKTLAEDETMVCTIRTRNGPRSVVCVSDSGLYALIFRSRIPEAQALRKRITNEFLPSPESSPTVFPTTQPEETHDQNSI